MKYRKRRISTGEMMMDVTKYLFTVGLVGGILTNKVNILSGILMGILVILFFVVAFFTIPPEN